MARLPVISGAEAVRAFERAGWVVDRQRGSHVVLMKEGHIANLSVPQHKELDGYDSRVGTDGCNMTEKPDIWQESVELSEADKVLQRLYEETRRSVDELAYTDAFEALYESFQSAGYDWSRPEVFRRLLVLRKAGLLPRLFRRSA